MSSPAYSSSSEHNNNNNNNNPINQEDNLSKIELIFRDEEYFSSWYIMKEEIRLSKTISKIYAFTKEKNFTITITKYSNIIISESKHRWESIITWVEENLLWVENLWLEQESPTSVTLFIAEYTKETYRNDFNLITFAYYLNEKKGVELSKSLSLLINLLKKVNLIHKWKNIAHLNLNPCNIYYNRDSNDIYLGPGWINEDSIKDNSNNNGIIWYMSPEWCYIKKIIIDDFSQGRTSDIWSIGCIIAEFFYIISPLFISFSQREKMEKIIEIIGLPDINDIDYMTQQEYHDLRSVEGIKAPEGRWNELFDDSGNNASLTHGCGGGALNEMFWIKKKMFEIVRKCLWYNRNKRIKIDEIINQIEELYQRYVQEKPNRRGIRTIINRENLWKAYSPKGDNGIENADVKCKNNYKNNKNNSLTRSELRISSPMKSNSYNHCTIHNRNKGEQDGDNRSFISENKYWSDYKTNFNYKSNCHWYNNNNKNESSLSIWKQGKCNYNFNYGVSHQAGWVGWDNDKEMRNWNESKWIIFVMLFLILLWFIELDDLVHFIHQMKSSYS